MSKLSLKLTNIHTLQMLFNKVINYIKFTSFCTKMLYYYIVILLNCNIPNNYLCDINLHYQLFCRFRILYFLSLTLFSCFAAAEMSDFLNTTTHNATEEALDTRLRPYQFASLTIITCVSFVVNVAILASVAKKKYIKKPYHLLVDFYHR